MIPFPDDPRVALPTSARLARLRLRLWQLRTCAVVVIAAGWLASLGVGPAIFAVLVAKHVLVAVLMAGLDSETPAGQAKEE